MWWCNAMWNMVWYEICYVNVGVVWNSCVCGMVSVRCGFGRVMWNMCFEMWWCEMVVGGRLRCNVMSDVEYGCPR